MLKTKERLRKRSNLLKPCCKVKILCLLFSIFLGKQLKCQDLSSPKFFKLNFQSLPFSSTPNYPQLSGLSTSSSTPSSSSGLTPNFLYEVALKYPIKMKGRTKIIGEIEHRNEYINGYYSSQLDEVEELELFQTSHSLIVMHDLNNKMKFTNVLQLSSNSTQRMAFSGGALRFSNLGLVEKETAKGSFGVGIAVSYDSRLSIMPLLKFEADLGKNWAIEALLPSKVLFAKNLSESARFLFGIKGSTATYVINDNELVADDQIGANYRRMSASGIIGYEKMLTPMVGLSLEMGASLPMRSGIYSVTNNREVLYDFDTNKISPHFRVGVFLALPK